MFIIFAENISMSFIKRHRYGIILFVICILMLAASAYAGYSMSKSESREEALTVSTEDKTEQDCVLTLSATYMICNHKQKSEIPVSAGLTLDDLKEEFPAYAFADFSSKRISASVRLNAYCPDHYLLKLEDDNMLWVYRTVENTQIQENVARYKDFNIESEQLDILKTGKLFSDMDDLTEYIKKINS